MGTIGTRVSYLIEKNDLRTQDAATFIGISQAALWKIKADKQEPGARVIIKISAYFNVSCDWLLTGKEFKKKKHFRLFG